MEAGWNWRFITAPFVMLADGTPAFLMEAAYERAGDACRAPETSLKPQKSKLKKASNLETAHLFHWELFSLRRFSPWRCLFTGQR